MMHIQAYLYCTNAYVQLECLHPTYCMYRGRQNNHVFLNESDIEKRRFFVDPYINTDVKDATIMQTIIKYR